MMRFRSIAVVLSLSIAAPASAAPLDATSLKALRDVDLRLATIAHRLVTANAPLCDETAPATGMVVHAIDQFDAETRPVARATLGFPTPVAVEAVVADGPAERAGIVAGDGLATIDGKPVPPAGEAQGSATRDATLTLIERARSPVAVGTTRGVRTVAAPAACKARFEVLLGPKMTAQSDGRVIQIGVRFFERYGDEAVAVVIAHELAHSVLRHRARLEAAGVKDGLLAEFGRNGRLHRRAEDEADRLGMHLLRNAGFDPAAAPRFWREHGGDIDGGLFRSRTHASSSARAKAIEAEIAAIPAGATMPYVPPLIATRDTPIDQ